MPTQISSQDQTVITILKLLEELFEQYHPRDFAVRFWDGTVWEAETETPRFTFVLNHPGALRRMVRNTSNNLSVGEAYIYNDFDIEGDIHSIFKVIDWLKAQNLGLATRLRLGWKLLHSPRKRKVAPGVQEAARVSGNRHSVARDQQAVTYHYDISNDFYALFLDKNLIYSCAYFEHDGEDLDTAQEHKLDYLCRKLRLKPGERLLDIGCGWGGLVIHAAKQYGVEALGITLSQPQADLANERIRQAGLSDRCRVEVRDYRQVSGTFDKMVSVGMFEHVGEDLLPAYFQKAWDLLPEGGVFLNHGIGRNTNIPWNRRTTFLNRYVFPDGELEPIHHTLQEAEKVGFEVRDVESLREHYALTLRHWMRHLEANHEKVLQCVSESTYRVWRLYMAGSVRGFDIGRVNLYQTLLVKAPRQSSGLPWTRADWYVGG